MVARGKELVGLVFEQWELFVGGGWRCDRNPRGRVVAIGTGEGQAASVQGDAGGLPAVATFVGGPGQCGDGFGDLFGFHSVNFLAGGS